MKAGLLGALGGLGQAMQTAGSDIIKRREIALAEARRMAEYERRRADQQEDKASDQDFQIGMEDARQTRLDARHSASLDSQATIASENRNFKVEDREDEQGFRASQAAEERAARLELTRLSKSLEGENSAAATRLSRTLSADDTHAVQYGAPDANGYAEVLVVTKSGKVRKTGQKVYRPAKEGEDDDDSL